MRAMRIITINVNGIRAAERKGFFDWLKKQNADVVCLQEIKAQEDQLDERFYPDDMHTFYHSAERKGYSGTSRPWRPVAAPRARATSVSDKTAQAAWVV